MSQYGHIGATCIHKNKRCHACGKLDHLSSVCWHNQQQKPARQRSQKASKNRSKSTDTMQATMDSSSDKDFDTNQLHIHNTSKSHTDKLTTVLAVSGVKVELEVDTGQRCEPCPLPCINSISDMYQCAHPQ